METEPSPISEPPRRQARPREDALRLNDAIVAEDLRHQLQLTRARDSGPVDNAFRAVIPGPMGHLNLGDQHYHYDRKDDHKTSALTNQLLGVILATILAVGAGMFGFFIGDTSKPDPPPPPTPVYPGTTFDISSTNPPTTP